MDESLLQKNKGKEDAKNLSDKKDKLQTDKGIWKSWGNSSVVHWKDQRQEVPEDGQGQG